MIPDDVIEYLLRARARDGRRPADQPTPKPPGAPWEGQKVLQPNRGG